MRVEIPYARGGVRYGPGTLLRLPVAEYRRYRGLGFYAREFVRDSYRGRTYLRALNCGCRAAGKVLRRGCGGCRERER